MAVDKDLRLRFMRVLDLNLRFDAPVGAGDTYLGAEQYVPGLHEINGTDPVGVLRDRIESSASEGAYLFSGMRGTGKTTELLRLKHDLEGEGEEGEFFVIYTDAQEHFNLLERVEIGDFLVTLCAAVAEEVAAHPSLGHRFVKDGYWQRFVDFLNQEIELKEFGGEASWGLDALGAKAKVNAKLALKDNPGFKRKLQEKLIAKTEKLSRQAEIYFSEVAQYLRDTSGKSRVLLIVDSLEHLRGATQEDSLQVYQSVASMFSVHYGALRPPGISIIYSIPPYLSAISQGFSAYYAGGRVYPLANVHVYGLSGKDACPNDEGVALMTKVIAARFPQWQTFFTPEGLRRLILACGGEVRDLFRLIQDCLTSARPDKLQVPFTEQVLGYAESVLREQFRFLSNEDMEWLARVDKWHRHEMPSLKELPQLAMLLDGKSMLNYRNGDDWYDVHPLLKQRVRDYVNANHARTDTAAPPAA